MSQFILLVTLLFTLLTWQGQLVALPQQTLEAMIKVDRWPSSPIEMTKINLNGRELELATRFTAPPKFVKDLRVTVKNISSKNVSFISLSIVGEESELHSIHVGRLKYGMNPAVENVAYINKEILKPREEATLQVGELRDGYDKFANIWIEVDMVAQDNEDEVIYERGAWLKKDPQHPGSRNVVSDDLKKLQ